MVELEQLVEVEQLVSKFREMETLVAVVQQRNQYYSRDKSHVSGRLDPSPSKGFGDINCRAFESTRGLLSSTLRTCSTPVSNKPLSSPKTPTPVANTPSNLKSKVAKPSKKNVKSSPITIDFKSGKKGRNWNNSAPFSELWAGPTYSNSPPPSSLPIPKFSLKPRRTVSLELPPVESEIDLHPIAKSAPTSPTRELKHSAVSFLHVDDSATKTLRRILNLDIAD